MIKKKTKFPKARKAPKQYELLEEPDKVFKIKAPQFEMKRWTEEMKKPE